MADCFAEMDVCAAQVSLAENDGTPMIGATVAYIPCNEPIRLGYAPIYKTLDRIESPIGCRGATPCLIVPECQQLIGYTLQLDLCEFDFRLAELLTGGLLVESDDDPDEIAGIIYPGYNTDCDRRLIFEAWTKQMSGGALNSPYGYMHHVWPLTTNWTEIDGERTLGQTIRRWQTTTTSNANLGLGPRGDLPAAGADGWEEGGMKGEFNALTLPACDCGYASMPVAS